MPPRRSARASASAPVPAAPAAVPPASASARSRYAESPESPATTTATTTAHASGLSTPATSVGGYSLAARQKRPGTPFDSASPEYASDASGASLPPERPFAVILPAPASGSRKRKAAAAAPIEYAEASGSSDVEFVSHSPPKPAAAGGRGLRRTRPQRVISPEDEGFVSGPSAGDASFGGGGFLAADASDEEPLATRSARSKAPLPRRSEALKPLAEMYSDDDEEAATAQLLAQSRAARAGDTPRQLARLNASASASSSAARSARPARAARPKSFKGLDTSEDEGVAKTWEALSEALALRLQAEEDERVGGGFVKDEDAADSDFGTPPPRAGPSRVKAAAAPKRAAKKARIHTSEEYEAPAGGGSDLSDAPSDDEEGEGLQEDVRWETAIQREKRLKRRKVKKGKGKQSQYERAHGQFSVHHPELATVWTDLAATAEPVAQQAAQPAGLTIKLLPFQLEGLHWLQAQEASAWKGGLLADEMGMGKTIQMISLFLSDRKKPVLVVIPTVAIMQWKNEIAKYTENFKVLVWHGSDRETDAAEVQKYDVVLATYAVLESSFRKEHQGFKRKGALIKEASAVHAIHWHRIVLDEAHNIKERSTNTAKAAFELKGTYRWCLSGTPLQNRVGDLYSQIKFLGGDPFSFYLCKKCPCKSAYWSFENNRYCRTCGHTAMSHGNFWNQEVLKPIQRGGASHGEGGDAFKRMRLLLSRIMLRRTKIERADDMGLPPRTIVVRQDKFSEEEEDLYTSLYQEGTRKFNTYLDQGTVLNNYSNIFTLLTRMRQMACHPDLVLRSKTGIAAKMLGDNAAEGVHVCRLCTDEAEDAIMSKCRHIFCRECVRTYYESSIAEGGTPDCPQCHARLTIDLEQEELEPPAQLAEHQKGRQGILERLDMDKWRSSSKIEALVEELERSKRDDSTTKSIVFSQFVNFLDLIAFRLQRAGYKICRLEGGMSPQARDNTIQHFMKNPDVTVFLVSLKAGGVALNLTEASRVYLMDPWWNGSVMAQSADRIHRLGQYRPIVIRYMVIEDSIESRILELQYKKQNMINAALSSDDAAMSRLSVADLQFLFQL